MISEPKPNNMDKLICKTIKELWISENKEYIRFITDQDGIIYHTSGDCCNDVWIEHIQGTVQLFNNTIVAVEEILYRESGIDEFAKLGDRDKHGCLDVFGYKLIMKPWGRVIIECRNNHNGYYCGSLEELTKPFQIDYMIKQNTHWNRVLEDF